MPYFVYGTDLQTGKLVSRFFADAATPERAREHAEDQGLKVLSVIPSHSTSAIVLPEVPPAQPTAAEAMREETVAFDHTLETITPRVVVAYVLVALNVLVFGLMPLCGADLFDPVSADLLRWGAEYGPRTTDGEPWRLFSSLFVHIGIAHLLYNMIAFLYVAPKVERMLGHVGFALTYVISGVAGGLWALLYNPTHLHAGASGAIFGIYGALLASLLRDRKSIPAHLRSELQRFVLVFVAYNLINSLSADISLAAHLGGLIGGFACGLALASRLVPSAATARTTRQVALGIGGAVLFVTGVAVADARYPNLGPVVASIHQAAVAMDKFHAAQEKNRRAQLGDVQFAVLIERELLPQWQAARTALANVAPMPTGLQANIKAIADCMDLRTEHWKAQIKVLRETKGRDWIQSATKAMSDDAIRKSSAIRSAYIDANVDLDFAKPAGPHGVTKLTRLRQLSARVSTLEARGEGQYAHLSFDDYSAFLENEQLPELLRIEQDLAALPQLPAALDQDAKAIGAHLRAREQEWEARVAYQHYQQWRKEADEKRSRADAAARAIKDARLRAPS
ncbi:MAG TPA: rhomboid family intramembrane serine protease [Rudaea sp.]